MQLMLSICKDSNDAKIIDLILIYKIVNFSFYDESRFSINNLNLIEKILIIIYIYILYQTLLSCIQLIFVSFIFKYIKELLKSKSNDDSNEVCRKLNNERRLIIQNLYNDLNYHCKKLRI